MEARFLPSEVTIMGCYYAKCYSGPSNGRCDDDDGMSEDSGALFSAL